MPLCRVTTNITMDDKKKESTLAIISREVSKMLGKPEQYVMTSMRDKELMTFAGTADPAAFVELKSIGLPEALTQNLSDKLCTLITEHTDIQANRIYIEFSDAHRKMWGFNNKTF